MQLATTPISDLWLMAPPMWLISNGDTTVGPVQTELLVRGIQRGRVPADCVVREVGWPRWRPLHQIREVNALQRSLDGDPERAAFSLREAATWFDWAADPGELMLFALHVAARATSAERGLLHRVRGPLAAPVTSYAYGGLLDRLGDVLRWDDSALLRARRCGNAFGSPATGETERMIALRLTESMPVTSVLMVPIFVHGELAGMLELGRSDRGFRVTDREELRSFAHRAGRWLEKRAPSAHFSHAQKDNGLVRGVHTKPLVG